MKSKRSQARQAGTQESRNSFQSIRCSHNVFCSFWVSIFLASNFQNRDKSVQESYQVQPVSTSTKSTPATLSVFTFSFSNYVSQEELRLRFRQASRCVKGIRTLPHQKSEHQGDSIQDDSAVHRRRQVVHDGSDDHEIQGAGVGLMESAQNQIPQPPPQQQNQESTSQWKSWKRIKSCFSVTFTEISFVEKHSGSGKESRRDRSTTITLLSQTVRSHLTFALFVLVWFCHTLVQFSSSIRSIMCSEPQCSALCHCSHRSQQE